MAIIVLLIVVKLKVSPADRVTYDYFIGQYFCKR